MCPPLPRELVLWWIAVVTSNRAVVRQKCRSFKIEKKNIFKDSLESPSVRMRQWFWASERLRRFDKKIRAKARTNGCALAAWYTKACYPKH